MEEKELRNLSGIYFREKIGNKWGNVCFEELSKETQDKILESKEPEFIKNLVKLLANTINNLGEQFDIETK